MLNGLAPILMFTFPPAGSGTVVAGIPVIGRFFSQVGVPIPIYLDEKLTGILVESENAAIDVDIQAEQTADGEAKVTQKGLDSTITVNMLAKKDAPLLGALLAFSDQIFLKAIANNYRLSYLNGSTLVFNGLLKSLTSTKGENDDLVRIAMVISKSNMLAPTPKTPTPQVTPIQGATPIG